MTLKQKNYNQIFWVLQLLGWGSFFLLVFLTLRTDGGIIEKTIFYISMCIVGILPTGLLRFYLKKTNSVANFSFFNVFKIIVGVALAALLMIKLPRQLGRLSRFLMDVLLDNPNLDISAPVAGENSAPTYLGSLLLIFVWTVIYLTIKYFIRLNKIRADKLQLKESIKQAQLNTLRGHLNPDFIVNALNGIKALMPLDVSKSRSLLTQLSEVLRYSLTKNNVNKVSLKDEVELVENYANLIETIFESKLDIRCNIEQRLLHHEIPPMLLVNLCEVGTKSDSPKSKEQKNIIFHVDKISNFLKLRIEYNDFTESNLDTVLMKRIKQRLKLLYKTSAEFKKRSTDSGVQIKINLPLIVQNQ